MLLQPCEVSQQRQFPAYECPLYRTPERRGVLADFAPVPYQPLPFRSVLVASDNDPYCPVRLAGAYARAWGSDFVRLANAGHINVESGHGPWPLGLALLQSLDSTFAATV